MKTHKSNTLQLKKLTVARINPETLLLLKGGSSVPPSLNNERGTARRVNGACVHIY
ncbi:MULTISPECIES: hypothetical protein [Aquimarina]|nr:MULTISPECIES: hypothetical protein [Aquimarina]